MKPHDLAPGTLSSTEQNFRDMDMNKGKNGLYEHQRLNFNVFRVQETNGTLKHCYARNQEKWFPCKRQEWKDVADDLYPGTWFLGLMLYKRYENNWLPNNDPRFMKVLHWVRRTEMSSQEQLRILDAILQRLDMMKDPILPSTRDFFNDMLTGVQK